MRAVLQHLMSPANWLRTPRVSSMMAELHAQSERVSLSVSGLELQQPHTARLAQGCNAEPQQHAVTD